MIQKDQKHILTNIDQFFLSSSDNEWMIAVGETLELRLSSVNSIVRPLFDLV